LHENLKSSYNLLFWQNYEVQLFVEPNNIMNEHSFIKVAVIYLLIKLMQFSNKRYFKSGFEIMIKKGN